MSINPIGPGAFNAYEPLVSKSKAQSRASELVPSQPDNPITPDDPVAPWSPNAPRFPLKRRKSS